MATKISSDISTNVDITARKNDSFFLEATVTNSDSTAFDLTNFTTINFSILNSSDTEVKKFTKTGTAATDTTETLKPATITVATPTNGIISIDVPSVTVNTDGESDVSYDNMNIQVGSYTYTLKIISSTETHTILHGKFKVID